MSILFPLPDTTLGEGASATPGHFLTWQYGETALRWWLSKRGLRSKSCEPLRSFECRSFLLYRLISFDKLSPSLTATGDLLSGLVPVTTFWHSNSLCGVDWGLSFSIHQNTSQPGKAWPCTFSAAHLQAKASLGLENVTIPSSDCQLCLELIEVQNGCFACF